MLAALSMVAAACGGGSTDPEAEAEEPSVVDDADAVPPVVEQDLAADEALAEQALLTAGDLGRGWSSESRDDEDDPEEDATFESVVIAEPACADYVAAAEREGVSVADLELDEDTPVSVESPAITAEPPRRGEVQHDVWVYPTDDDAAAPFDLFRDYGLTECMAATVDQITQAGFDADETGLIVTDSSSSQPPLGYGDRAAHLRIDLTVDLPDGTTGTLSFDWSLAAAGRAVSAVFQFTFDDGIGHMDSVTALAFEKVHGVFVGGEVPEVVSAIQSAAADSEARRDDYVAALSAAMGESVPGFDAYCLSEGVIEAVGVETLVDEGIEVVDLAAEGNLEGSGLRVGAALQKRIAVVVGRCLDTEALTEWMISLLDLGELDVFDEEGRACMTEAFEEVMSAAVVDEVVDGSGLNDAMFAEMSQAGVRCGAESTISDSPGSDVSWLDGEDAFTAALITDMTTPTTSETVVVHEDEARCFAEAIVDVLSAELSEVPATTVGDLELYLAGATTQEAIGITVDEPMAQTMAEVNIGCIDQTRILAETTTTFFAMLEHSPETDAAFRYEECADRLLTDDIWVENFRLTYLYGPAVASHPDGLALFKLFATVGEICTAEVFSPQAGT